MHAGYGPDRMVWRVTKKLYLYQAAGIIIENNEKRLQTTLHLIEKSVSIYLCFSSSLWVDLESTTK